MDVFEAQNPHITMEYRNWPWAEFHTKLLTQAAAGTAPDAFAHSNVFYPKYVKRGGALGAGRVRKNGTLNSTSTYFLPVSLKLSTVDGKLYGLPHISSAWGIIYNKQVMEDAGITESPNDLDARGEWNWESNLETAQEAHEARFGWQGRAVGTGRPRAAVPVVSPVGVAERRRGAQAAGAGRVRIERAGLGRSRPVDRRFGSTCTRSPPPRPT